MAVVIVAGSALIGWLCWTLTEYLAHRYIFHPRRDGRVLELLAREHTRHHREPLRTNLSMRIAGHIAIAVAATPAAFLIWWIIGPAVGVGGWLGWVGGYVLYEETHWRLHHRAPATGRGRHIRLHHYAHHSVDVGTNFGITVMWWDTVFGTIRKDAVVSIPRSQAAPWLLTDTDGYEEFDLNK